MCTRAVSTMLKGVPGVESVDCEKTAAGKPTGKVTVTTNKKLDTSLLEKAVSGNFSAKVAQ